MCCEIDETLDYDEEDVSEVDEIIYEEVDFRNALLPKHLRCASHTLNLIAAVDIVKIIKSSHYLSSIHFGVLEKCTAVWNTLRYPKWNEVLHEHLGATLLRPVITRWNSLYDALERIVAFKQQIIQVSPLIGITNTLTENDFRYIQEYLKILKPLAETIDLLQGENFCYYGYLLPSLVSLKRKMTALHQSISDGNARFGPLISGIIKSIEVRFQPFFSMEDEVAGAAIAAVSHPRFKSRWLNSFSDSIRRKVKKLILTVVTEEHRNRQQTTPEVNVSEQQIDNF